VAARSITIAPATNGWVVSVGCWVLVFENTETLSLELGRYLRNPDEVEKEYIQRYIPNSGEVPMPVESAAYGGAQANRNAMLDRPIGGGSVDQFPIGLRQGR
jgi:hypothetical protein